MIIYTDNEASKKTIDKGKINSKLKYINIHSRYNIDNILKNKIILEYVNIVNKRTKMSNLKIRYL